MKRAVFTAAFITLTVLLFSAPVIYQAENGVNTGNATDTTTLGVACVGIDGTPASCAVTVNVPTGGMYTITIRYYAPDYKENDLYANGTRQAGVVFPVNAGFTTITAGMVPLMAGNNEIKIVATWGWVDIDWFGVEAAVVPPIMGNRIPVNPNSTAAVNCLLNYFADIYGSNIVSGQCGDADVTWINTATGQYPAIKGFDMMDYSPSRVAFGATSTEAEKAIAWHQAGGIVQFQWHWNAPNKLSNTAGCEWWRGFYNTCSTFDVKYAMDNPASQDYLDILRDIDAIAVQLKKLRDAGVPVLWRPLHEAQGGWFWWGSQGYDACVRLYRLVYDRLTNYHGLNNLIWVWTSQDNAQSINWYPGDAYVDIVGADIYLNGLDYSPSTSVYYNILSMVNGNKMVALTETGTIPDMAQAQSEGARWLYFMTWNGFENDTAQNSLAHVQSVYGSPYVINRPEVSAFISCMSATMTPTVTQTKTATRTATKTHTQTATPTPTRTQTASSTPTGTGSGTPVITDTDTRTHSPTATYTRSATPTSTNTQAEDTSTATQTATRTGTNTPVNTDTRTNTATNTSTAVNTPTATGTSVTGLTGLIVFCSDRGGKEQIYSRDLSNGVETNISSNAYNDFNPMMSRDGNWMVFTSDRSGNYQIYKMDMDDFSITRLTSNGATEWDPSFSPDGARIVFKSNRDDGYGDIFIMNSDGTGQVNLTAGMASSEEWDPDFTRDGSQIVFVSRLTPGDSLTDEIYLMNANGTGPVRLTNNTMPDWYPSCNPLSDEILFVSKTSAGQPDNIFTMDYSGSGKSVVSSLTGDNDDPYYNADGSKIVYVNNSPGNYNLYLMDASGAGNVLVQADASNELCPAFVPPYLTHTATNTPSYTATRTATLTQTTENTSTNTVTATPTLTWTSAIFTWTFTRTPQPSATATKTMTPTTSITIPPTGTMTPTIFAAPLVPDVLTVFPNPFDPDGAQDLGIVLQPAKVSDVIVKVYTNSFRCVLSEKFNTLSPGKQVVYLSKSGFKSMSNGTYFMQVEYNYGSREEKSTIKLLLIIK